MTKKKPVNHFLFLFAFRHGLHQSPPSLGNNHEHHHHRLRQTRPHDLAGLHLSSNEAQDWRICLARHVTMRERRSETQQRRSEREKRYVGERERKKSIKNCSNLLQWAARE